MKYHNISVISFDVMQGTVRPIQVSQRYKLTSELAKTSRFSVAVINKNLLLLFIAFVFVFGLFLFALMSRIERKYCAISTLVTFCQ